MDRQPLRCGPGCTPEMAVHGLVGVAPRLAGRVPRPVRRPLLGGVPVDPRLGGKGPTLYLVHDRTFPHKLEQCRNCGPVSAPMPSGHVRAGSGGGMQADGPGPTDGRMQAGMRDAPGGTALTAAHHRHPGPEPNRMPCSSPCARTGDGSGAPEPQAQTGRARRQNPCRRSMGVDSSRTHRGSGMAGIHPIPWGGAGTKQVMFGLPVHHPNMLSRPGNSGMLIGFSLPGIHHSGLRTGSTNNRTVGERCWIAISQLPCDPASEAPRQGWACRNGLPGNMQVLGEVRG